MSDYEIYIKLIGYQGLAPSFCTVLALQAILVPSFDNSHLALPEAPAVFIIPIGYAPVFGKPLGKVINVSWKDVVLVVIAPLINTILNL